MIWRPRHGSPVSHRAMTASLNDSREFLNARRHAEASVLLPPGPRVAFSGGTGFNDHTLIWAKLDQVMARHPDRVLLHGGSDRGAERHRAARRRRPPRSAACQNRRTPRVNGSAAAILMRAASGWR
jgi:hypothetical protein